MIKKIDALIKDRYWFGWWYATICSRHLHRDPDCHLCQAGGWTRQSHKKLFGTLHENYKEKNMEDKNKLLDDSLHGRDFFDESPDYYFFWAGECSQWLESPFIEFGENFNTAEQFMMAAKAKVFGDDETYEKIKATASPAEQKKLGRQVKGFDAEKWNAVARDYVTLGNYNKFTQNSQLYDFLMQNKSKFFVEASPYDKVWGIGMGAGTPGVENPANWKGSNWLGQCINTARDIIISENVKVAGVKNPFNIEELRIRLNWNVW